MTWVSAHGAREPLSKPPFLTIGVATEHPVGEVVAVVAVTVATTVVTMVVGERVAVRMQEQALLSLDGGYVVTGRSRLPLAAGVTVVLGLVRTEKDIVAWLGRAYATVAVALNVGRM